MPVPSSASRALPRATVGALLVALLVMFLGPVGTAGAAETRLRDAVERLPVAAEANSGYDRTLFRHWVDADGDCQNTRHEVLRQESTVAVTGGCTVKSGRWVSYYDKVVHTAPGNLDVDHMVALAEAWGSGARRWDGATRQRFANDLGDKRALVAVTASVNRSKADRDPAQWLPKYNRCRYVREWTVVKLRWKLAVDGAEKRRLRELAAGCRNVTVAWTPAPVTTTSGTGSPVKGVRLASITYNPSGSDTSSNVNGEKVVIANRSAYGRKLTGWTLQDAAGHRFTFPTFTLKSGASVTVHSGKGSPTAGHLYAGWGHIWNNTGDKAVLRNEAGTLAHSCAYSGGGSTATCG
ncbi:lamin tail domain-containing protein [Ornithinicoccus halotolerans]|uniref:lamin tail domain-containing protein n=1 Tax=Ornithinicoccus halotolerans TaxID=1748220 RepID=UPI0012980332|nr:lamin tail domain-containing protein [Ornithinicoccus halotolerans]